MDVKPLNPAAPPRGQAAPSADGRPPVAATAPTALRLPAAGEFREPDWTRIPGYRTASRADWESALWQRKHTVKNLRELKETLGGLLPDTCCASIERDQRERATMSILIRRR
jgi:lysine 2,3-aminomutase